jgi:hypothetical protein
VQATLGGERVPAAGTTTGTAVGTGAGRTRRWRRALAGYTTHLTTYVAAHVMPVRWRHAAAAVALPAPAALVVAPIAPPVAPPVPVAAERDERWPADVALAVARILIAIDWALPGRSARRR